MQTGPNDSKNTQSKSKIDRIITKRRFWVAFFILIVIVANQDPFLAMMAPHIVLLFSGKAFAIGVHSFWLEKAASPCSYSDFYWLSALLIIAYCSFLFCIKRLPARVIRIITVTIIIVGLLSIKGCRLGWSASGGWLC
jgi:hypothetical protein